MRKPSDVFSDAAASANGGMVSSALFAFNTNVDLVKRTDEKGALEIAKNVGLPALEECVRKHKGAEVSVDREKLGRLMALGYDEKRIGGQSGIMANVAASMGIRSYLHASTVCREIAQHLNPKVMVSSPFCFQPATEIMSDGEAPVHFVVDFGADRFIATYDMHNTHMLINRNFKRCAEKEIRLVDKAVVSGFHLLDIPEPRGRIEEARVLVRRWKVQNRRLKVHLELGDYQKPKVLGWVLEMLAPECDSIGMNAQELKDAAKAHGAKAKDEAGAMDAMLEVCKSVVLHTGEYAVVAGADAKGAGKRLALGHMMASFMAKEGRPPTPEELQKMEAKPVQVKSEVRKKFGKEYAFVPALRGEAEKTKLGLGDAFSVGYFCSKEEG